MRALFGPYPSARVPTQLQASAVNSIPASLSSPSVSQRPVTHSAPHLRARSIHLESEVTVDSPVPVQRRARKVCNPLPPSSPPPTSPMVAPADGTGTFVASRLVNDPGLTALGAVVNVEERVVICLGCDHAILPSALVHHVHTEHNIPLPHMEEREKILPLCRSYDVHETMDRVRFPSFGCAPIEGLKPKDGFVCRTCQYAAPRYTTLVRHWSTQEHKDKCGNINSLVGIRKGLIQSFFHPGNQKWFEVELSMMGVDSGDPFALYQATYGLEFDKGPVVLYGAENGREVPPMTRLTRWDEHLSKWLATRTLVDNLLLLVDLRKSRNDAPGIGYLPEITARYLDRMSNLANSSPLHVRSLLMDCPRTDNHGRVWKPHTIMNTLIKYGEPLRRFACALLRSVSTSSPTTYQFPLSDLKKREVHLFAERLNQKAPASEDAKARFKAQQVDHFHTFLALFFLAREPTNTPLVPSAGKYDEVLECFCAVSSVRSDGLLQTPKNTSQLFAHLKYLIRGILLCEGEKRRRESLDKTLAECVEELGMRNLAVGRPSPFNMVVDYQRATSAIVYSSVQPLQMRISEDGHQFTYLTKTLDFPAFKFGLKRGVAKMRQNLDSLMFGLQIPLSFPKIWVDDWTNETRGYSFLSEHSFTAGARPWIKGLLGLPELDLVKKDTAGHLLRDTSGHMIWNSAAMQEIFARNTAFMHSAMPVTFFAASGSRGQEFADAKIGNGPRPRGIFVEADGRVWIVTRRIKTEGQTGGTVFIPSMLPDDIAQILLTYLIVIRPGLVELAHIYYDAHASMLYREFLWVTNTSVLDSNALTKLLDSFTEVYCGGIPIGLQPWRQIIVAIYRVYLGSENLLYELYKDQDQDEEDILTARMGHTVSTARKHYGVEFGVLPCVSRELFNRFRSGSILHHQLLSLLPGADELLPLVSRFGIRTRRTGQGGESAAVADIMPALSQLISSEMRKLGEELLHKLQPKQTIVQDVPHLPSFLMDLDQDFQRSPSLAPPSLAPPSIGPDANALSLPTPSSPHAEIPTRSIIPTGAIPVDALALLRELLDDPAANWKSEEQAEGIRLALAREESFVLILNVGEGKSFAYQIPALHEAAAKLWSLVVCPNKSLVNDQLQSCRKLGLTAFQWYAKDHGRPVPAHTNVIFVALETAVAPKFKVFVLDHMAKVARIFYDEIHELLCDSDYRKQWPKLQYLRAIPAQQIFGSATLALRTMKQFTTALALPPSIKVVRSDFVQRQMCFVLLELDDQKTDLRRFLNDLQSLLKEKYMGADGQGIIFRAHVNEIFSHWHPEKPKSASFSGWEHRLEHETLWLEHKSDWLMSMSTCIHGINNLRCNVVIFVNFHPILLLFGQGYGRGGRKGQECLVIFIKHGRIVWMQHPSQDDDTDCRAEGIQFMANTPGQCRRHIFGLTFNGKPQTCASVGGVPCDRCDPDFWLWAEIQAIVPDQPPADDSDEEYHRHFSDRWFNDPEVTKHEPPSPTDWFATYSDSAFHIPDLIRHPEPPLATPSNRLIAPQPVQLSNQPQRPVSTTRQFLAPQPGPVQPSNQIQGQAMEFQQAMARRRGNSGILGRLSERITGHCAACWAFTGDFIARNDDHRTFRSCSRGNNPTSAAFDDRYRTWEKLIEHPEYTACYKCGFPQDDQFLLFGHPKPSRQAPCPHVSAMKHILWVVRTTKNFWDQAYKRFKLGYTISDKDFAAWAVCDSSPTRHHNGVEMILWLNSIHKTVT
ncbi:hypothetical protein K438DRAFT_1971892 [Mycena galopus ATCC 62051]|nr:hypothetical protein K438DRAFT_1971892 [Mycena galopus ATCC 62051]